MRRKDLAPALVAVVLNPAFAQAGVFETLSEGAYYLSKGACPKYDGAATNTALQKAESCSLASNSASVQTQAQELLNTSSKITETLENRFFRLLAKQHSKELVCASQFAETLKSGHARELDQIHKNVKLLRQAKRQLISASQELANNPNILSKVCPLTLEELTPNPIFKGQPDEFYETCKKIITNRAAVQTILSAIPLSNIPPLDSVIEKYANMSETDASGSDAELAQRLREAYLKAGQQLKDGAKELENNAKAGGELSFDRHTKYALLFDPKVVRKVIDESGDARNLEALACQADARYKQGADKLEAASLTASATLAIFSGGLGLAARSGSVGFKIAQGASAARATGSLTQVARRVLQASSFGVISVSAYSDIDKNCFSSNKPKQLIDSDKDCVSAPNIKQLETDSCVLGVALSALEFAGVASSVKPTKLLQNARLPSLGGAKKPDLPPILSDLVRTQVSELDKMGVKYSKIDRHKRENRLLETMRENEQGQYYIRDVDELFEVTQGATRTGRRSGGTKALEHPDFPEKLRELQDQGYRLLIDPTLSFPGSSTMGIHHGGAKIIYLRPDSDWETFIHELQHKDFSLFIKKSFESAELTIKAGKRIEDALPAEALSRYSKRELREIENYIRADATQVAINERLSGMREMSVAGFRRYIPAGADHDYTDSFMLKVLEEAKRLGPLTPDQQRVMRQIKGRALADMGRSVVPIVSAGTATALGLGVASYELLANEKSGEMLFRATPNDPWLYVKSESPLAPDPSRTPAPQVHLPDEKTKKLTYEEACKGNGFSMANGYCQCAGKPQPVNPWFERCQ